VLEGERADARDDMFSLGCLAYLLLSGVQPFPKRTAMEAREAKFRLRRPANVSRRQWQALRSALRWEREDRPTDVLQWLSDLELGAARKLPPFNDLLEPPAAKEPKSWLAVGVAAGVAALLFAVYWLVSNRNMLPSIDSTASIRAPANPAPPSADAPQSADTAPPVSSTPATTSPPSAKTAPFNQAKPPPAAALRPSAPIAASASHEAPVAVPSPAAAASSAAAASHVAAAPPVSAPSPPPAKAAAGASKVELAADSVDVPAGQASAQITVHRKGNLRGETSFTWWTESGTAKPGADFSAVVPQLAYVGDGKSNVSLSIPLSIAPHAQAKSFYVVIDQTDGGATLGARTLTMVTLQPND
jgi:hypothetical protein